MVLSLKKGGIQLHLYLYRLTRRAMATPELGEVMDSFPSSILRSSHSICEPTGCFLECRGIAREFLLSGLVGPHILKKKKNSRLFQPAVPGFVLQKYNTGSATFYC
jgi:hypothetical protein